MGAARTSRMTAAEYLAWEREQPDKHEFANGHVFPMAGGSPRHNYLSGAAIAELRAVVRVKGCSVLTSDQRVAAQTAGRYVYPDAVVVCGPIRFEEGTTDVLANPTVIVEVVSKSAEAYERGGKWEAYQRLASLTDYLLLSQTHARVEHYSRETDGSWRYRDVGAGGTIRMANGASLSVDAIYDGAFELEGD